MRKGEDKERQRQGQKKIEIKKEKKGKRYKMNLTARMKTSVEWSRIEISNTIVIFLNIILYAKIRVGENNCVLNYINISKIIMPL